MPRKKPFSAKQRKAQIQEKRAIQRGDSPPPSSSTARRLKPGTTRNGRPQRSEGTDPTSTRLTSRFIALGPEYLERTRNLAHSTLLARPIPDDHAIFPVEELMLRDEGRLTCPGRPKFMYGQTKKEVEKNEEGMFKKWLKATEEIVKDWVVNEKIDEHIEGASIEGNTQQDVEDAAEKEDGGVEDGQEVWPRSPSWFETNLEVWRQLWRVTESSSILLLLLDSRCPPLHCPPSLRTYIQSAKMQKEVILILTKSDLVDPAALEGWKEWTKDWWGRSVEVVTVTSYDQAYLQESGKHRPDIPVDSMYSLVAALQRAHERLVTPPDHIRDDKEKLAKWLPRVRPSVDWHSLLQPGSSAGAPESSKASTADQVELGNDGEVEEEELEDGEEDIENGMEEDRRKKETEPLTIGLIGQPNVGKSSLLNALLGEQRVRASKTPGKTKHFQTMFWGDKKEVKLVDCPGLVCPSLVGLEIQALAGILPISQIPSLPACIYYAARLIPLEEIFRIPPPTSDQDEYESKKTWRTPRVAGEKDKNRDVWTAGSIMEGRALDRGYITAKGGRPDGNRAANGMMRSLADGRIHWGFWPPGSDVTSRQGRGIYLSHLEDAKLHDVHRDEAGEEDSDDGMTRLRDAGGTEEDTVEKAPRSDGSDEEVEEESEEEGPAVLANRHGFFAALEDGNNDEDEDKDEEDDEDDDDDHDRDDDDYDHNK